MIQLIKQQAKRIGACPLIGEIKDKDTLLSSFFSPQGREFCERYNFPSIELFRQIKPEITEDMAVFVDFGQFTRSNDKDIALIGETCGELIFDENKTVHKIILMHGAKAVIKVSNYAVLLIVNIGGCEVTINKDETARIL